MQKLKVENIVKIFHFCYKLNHLSAFKYALQGYMHSERIPLCCEILSFSLIHDAQFRKRIVYAFLPPEL